MHKKATVLYKNENEDFGEKDCLELNLPLQAHIIDRFARRVAIYTKMNRERFYLGVEGGQFVYQKKKSRPMDQKFLFYLH